MWLNRQYFESETFPARKILIVDDDPEVCQLLNILLRSRGYQTTSLASGIEAVNWIENSNPDVILLDVMMPEMDGWETFRQLRDRSSAPVVFLTALTSGEVAAQALTIGVNDFVRKPFHPDELVARIQTLLSNEQTSPMPPGRRFHYQGVKLRPTVSLILPTVKEAENLPPSLPYIPMDVVDDVVLVDGRSTDVTV